MTAMSFGFVACSDDDNDSPSVSGDLISQTPPTTNGWSGDFVNGVAEYANLSNYESGDPVAFLAFSFKDGVCTDGVVNVVMQNEATAKILADMLKSGVWDEDYDDDDDDDYYYYRSLAPTLKVTRKMMCVASKSRSDAEALPINVSRQGKVVYIQIPNVSGIPADDIQKVVAYWDGGSYSGYTPNKVLFGKYENGVYTCDNMMGIGMDYRIDTEFNEAGFCTEFLTTLTFTTSGWAQAMYEQLKESIDEQFYQSIYGDSPKLNINGKKVTLEAVIVDDIDQANVDAFIAAIDWINNRPVLWSLFE